MVKLNSISRAAAAHQLRCSEGVEQLLILALRTRRTDRDVFVHGPARHRERVEKLFRARRQLLDALFQHRPQRNSDGRTRLAHHRVMR